MNSVIRNITFNKIWSLWPKKDKKASALKGYELACSQRNLDPVRLMTSVEIYISEVKESKYCHDLGNWFRDDHYKDIYDHFKDLDKYQDELNAQREMAEKIVTDWNSACKPHWLKVENIEDRMILVKDAMYNTFFKENWEKALAELEKIFAERFPLGDWRRKIKPSLSWFCNTSYESHNVARIIEGELGHAEPVEKERVAPEIVDPADDDEVERTFNELMEEL